MLITSDIALVLRDTATGKERKLFSVPQGTFVAFPAWAPDRSKFAFTLIHPFAGRVNGKVADWSGQLYDAQGQFTGRNDQVRRLDLNTGTVTLLVDGATDGDLCRDGSQLAFTRVDWLTGTGTEIGLADGDGTNRHTLVATSAQAQNFLYPRFSPDCRRLVFAASGSTAAHLRQPGTSRFSGRRGNASTAHGPPYEIWTINLDGSGLRQLTHFGEDEPYPALTPNGGALFVLGANGLYRLLPDGTELTRIRSGTTLGQLSLR